MEKILGDRIVRTLHLSEETEREEWFYSSSRIFKFWVSRRVVTQLIKKKQRNMFWRWEK